MQVDFFSFLGLSSAILLSLPVALDSTEKKTAGESKSQPLIERNTPNWTFFFFNFLLRDLKKYMYLVYIKLFLKKACNNSNKIWNSVPRKKEK